METSPTFRNYQILKINPRAAVAIDESLGGLELRAVIMRGSVQIIDGPDKVVREGIRRIYERYLAPHAVDGIGVEMTTNTRHALLRFRPTSTISWDTVARDS